MTMTVEAGSSDEVRDFSYRRRSIMFRIDGDVFEASPDIPVELALRFTDDAEVIGKTDVPGDRQIQIMHNLLRMILLPSSADRFIERLSDPERPIGTQRLNDVIQWLFEEYGLRPTESDSPSSGGSENPASGTSLTVTASDAASTLPS